MALVKELQSVQVQAYQPTLFIIELSRDAALHNTIVLENYNFNLM